MDFKTRPIKTSKTTKINKLPTSNNPHKKTSQPSPIESIKEQNNFLKHHLVPIIGALAIFGILIYLLFSLVKSLDFSSFIFSFGKNLQNDGNGSTNILLVGIGGPGHDGPDLTDTIMVAHIDYIHHRVPLISIPRDLFVNTKQTGKSKINAVYANAKNYYGDEKGMQVLQETVSQVTGLPIQYYVKIDFKGFEDIVNNLGGVDVNVEKPLVDTQFPNDATNGWETFTMDAGLQHMDGTTALKYARSRHSTSDFDRARRQQELMYSIKQKALSLNVLTSPDKIQELYQSINESVSTSLSLGEIIQLAKIAQDYGKESVFPIVYNDDPTTCGGVVYTPDRAYFADASVELQVGSGYDYVHFLTSTVLGNVEALTDQDKVQVLNGTKVPGLAYEGMSALSRFCVNVVYYTNAQDTSLQNSTIYYLPDANGNPPKVVNLIQAIMPGMTLQNSIPPAYLANPKRQDSKVVVVLGKDYLTNRLPDPFKNLQYLPTITPINTQENGSSTQQSQVTSKSPVTTTKAPATHTLASIHNAAPVTSKVPATTKKTVTPTKTTTKSTTTKK